MLMHRAPDLRVLFATDLSDTCTRAGEAVAQLADWLTLDLTIVHGVRPGRDIAGAQHALDRTLSTVRHLARCRRVVVETSDACAAIADLCQGTTFDLVVAPNSPRVVPRALLAGSFRAQLFRRSRAPLWTAGACLPRMDFQRDIGSIACLVDFDDQPQALLRAVTAFASRFGARVQAIAVLPPIDDGTIGEVAQSETPLRADLALARVHAMRGAGARTDVCVAVGAQGPELRRILARSGADLLFVGSRQVAPGHWRPRFSGYLDGLPCPVVCVTDASRLTGRAFREVPGVPEERRTHPVVAS